MEKRIYIGNLPEAATEDELQAHFSQAGSVVSVALIKERDTGRSKGFAFVEMATSGEAQEAITMFQGRNFMGRDLIVNIARPRLGGDPTTDAPLPDVGNKKRKGK